MYPATLMRAFPLFLPTTPAPSSDRLEVEGGPRRPREFQPATNSRLRLLAKPVSPLFVLEHGDGLPGREDDVEIPSPHGRVRPPTVDDTPLLTYLQHLCAVDGSRISSFDHDLHRSRLVQSSRGTRIARASGTRDHGATSTTVQIASMPTAARTWRKPSRRRPRSRLPRGRTSSAWVPTDSVSSPSSRRSSTAGAGSSLSFGASAGRGRSGSAVGSRSVAPRRQAPPPTSRAETTSRRGSRPPRS